MRLAALVLALLSLMPGPVSAAQVTDLGATHRQGQTFVTWTVPTPGTTGWTYRLYASDSPIVSSIDLNSATLIGSVGDSTWCNRRMTRIVGVVTPFVTDSAGPPLSSTQGLFVTSPATAAARYYAVTAQAAAQPEDRVMTVGQNTLTSAITEIPETPRPIYQGKWSWVNVWMEVYALWVSPVDTPDFPAMSNRYGEAYNCGIRRGTAGSPLCVTYHARGGFFLGSTYGSGTPGDWTLAPDDYTFNPYASNTWWYGFHENFSDATSIPPTTGQVIDYTRRRLKFTFDWALRNFPVDKNRLYSTGGSMGGIGATMTAFWWPTMFAAVSAAIPRVDFIPVDDPNTYPPPVPTCSFNSGGTQRVTCDILWGTQAAGLLGPDGLTPYESMSAPFMAGTLIAVGVPPMSVFNGRRDGTIGWEHLPSYYQIMQNNHLGGVFWWDQRDHLGIDGDIGWLPMYSTPFLGKFRLDRSFPAFSNCSQDNDPGNGTSASGDTLGTINGYVDWDTSATSLVDTASEWGVTLRLRNLASKWQSLPAPESLTVNVSPRRLQQFSVAQWHPFEYTVERLSDHVIIQSGSVTADQYGVITVPEVKIFYPSGSRLRLTPLPITGVRPAAEPSKLSIMPHQNPVYRMLSLAIHWSGTQRAELALFDLSGRRVRTLFSGRPNSLETTFQANLDVVPTGIYFLRATQNNQSTVARIVLIQ